MNRLITLLLSMMALSCSMSYANHKCIDNINNPWQQVDTQEQQTFKDLSQRIWVLMADKNADELAGIFHNNCFFVHMGGYWGKEQELSIIKSGMIHYKNAEVYGVEVKDINENNVVVYSTIVLDAVVGGNTVTTPFFVTQFFTKESNTWQLASFVFTTRTAGPGVERSNH